MIKSCLSKAKTLFTLASRNFVVTNTRNYQQNKYNLQGTLDHYSMKLRKLALERSILDKEKVVLKIARLRKEEDTLAHLKKNNMCAGELSSTLFLTHFSILQLAFLEEMNLKIST